MSMVLVYLESPGQTETESDKKSREFREQRVLGGKIATKNFQNGAF
jgi:hypothetical protein